jgi:pyruvate,water dikinase
VAKKILPFSSIDKSDIDIVGGKGANLGELFKIKAPVPDGFVVTSHAYYQFLDETGLRSKIHTLLKSVDVNNHKILDGTSKLIKHVILKEKMSPDLEEEIRRAYLKLSPTGKLLVAVRSSATAEDLPGASFAGQQATFLNIEGEKDLIKSVQECWASLFEARAIFYREEKKFNHFKVGIAVVVQEMVESEVSGVMFTIDPITNDKSKIIIESVWGLGELIVQGKVTPDHYEVSKKGFAITQKEIGKQAIQLIKTKDATHEVKVGLHYQAKQKLPDKLIVELARIGRTIENHYLFPQDLEWAENSGKLYIVQTRPVTTIAEKSTLPTGDSPLKKLKLLLSGASASPGVGTGGVRILKSAKDIDKLVKGEVLVTEMTNPDFVPAMRKASAIVTDRGGKTSHAAIVSRELGIPAVVGTLTATKRLKTGQVITVDGANGKIYQGGLSSSLNLNLLNKTSAPTLAHLKTATKVYVNLGEPELAASVAKKEVDGVGLLRAEFMIAEIGIHPRKLIHDKKQSFFVEKLASGLKTFCEAFGDRPVIYRATDFKTNEYKNLIGGSVFEVEEPNPMLGFRGAYRYIADPQVFEMELAAIKRVRHKLGHDNLWLMIPFVRTVEELKEVKKLVTSNGLHRSQSFKLLMMAEIPANVFLIDEFLDVGIDGISIGSNDLTMLTLGVDRDNQTVASEFSELNPAVLKALETLIRIGQNPKKLRYFSYSDFLFAKH